MVASSQTRVFPLSVLLAICFESFMKRDIAVRKAAVKRKCEKHLLRNALVDKSGNILKSKYPVVLRMPD